MIFAPPQHATAEDTEVMQAFVCGYALEGDTMRSIPLGNEDDADYFALISHGVVIGLYEGDDSSDRWATVVFDVRPQFEGGTCVCRLKQHITQAMSYVFEDDAKVLMDHDSFVELAERIGAEVS